MYNTLKRYSPRLEAAGEHHGQGGDAVDWMQIFGDEEPAEVFRYFSMISDIPRQSGDQRRISDFLLAFGRDLGLESRQDGALNVIITKGGSTGYEKDPPIILQAHMDMVCEQNHGGRHNFSKDPLELLRDGDKIRAKGTSLGADNGLGVAFIMALLADAEAVHPPIEAVLTTDEETDMAGARALDLAALQGNVLVNLDAPAVTVCGSGELEVAMRFVPELIPVRRGWKFCSIAVNGLAGGHSGQDATKERGNAIVLLHRILLGMEKQMEFQLVSFWGGAGMSSAFAREAHCTVAVQAENMDFLVDLAEESEKIFRRELQKKDPYVRVRCTPNVPGAMRALNDSAYRKFTKLLTLLPDGVASRNPEYENAMESCANVGVVETHKDEVLLTVLIRSTTPAKKYHLYDKVVSLCDMLGVFHSVTRDIPHWERRLDDDLAERLQALYPGKNFGISQGTLECGIFGEKKPELSMVALGAPYYSPHSSNEWFSISETREYWHRFLDFLRSRGKPERPEQLQFFGGE